MLEEFTPWWQIGEASVLSDLQEPMSRDGEEEEEEGGGRGNEESDGHADSFGVHQHNASWKFTYLLFLQHQRSI